MTGTPVENTLLDLWSLADFAIPGMLGDKTVFEVEFPDTVEAGQALGQFTDPIILKRRVKDVAADLPDRIDIDLPLELDAPLARHYDRVREVTMKKYPVAGALVATLQLQLVCAHPWLRAQDAAAVEVDDAQIVVQDELPLLPADIQGMPALGMSDTADPLVEVMNRKLTLMRRKHAQTREYMEMNALRGIVKDGAGTTLYNYFTEFGLAQIAVDFVFGMPTRSTGWKPSARTDALTARTRRLLPSPAGSKCVLPIRCW